MIDYQLINASQAERVLTELSDVLHACVAAGASVGFTDPDDHHAIETFWHNRISDLASGESALWVARQQGVVVATVMLNHSAMPNGRHRAEISKLLVHPRARRQGIARQLMLLAEAQAHQQGKTLLVLDTRSGDVASALYLSLGWQIAGTIPCYALSISGEQEATTLMYKLLPEQ